MTWITPGFDFLVENLVLPASLNYGFLSVVLHFLRLPRVPRWALVSLSLALVPGRMVAGAVYTYQKHKRQARARGARLPPVVVGDGSIGNRDLLPRMRDAWKLGYPGDEFWDLLDKYGSLFNFRVMFADTVFTIDPANVKRILSTDFDNFVKR
ncbi:hypothetical protein NMY22_g14710 [Coprinellus aureogranulatus]|nr:hypothetical protein NMY22_g14710 [Coprinellus aureogranulatus]